MGNGSEFSRQVSGLIKQFMLELLFSVQATTLEGERVCIAGSSPEMGNWDPLSALLLHPRNGLWEGELPNARAGIKIEFKIIKVREGKVIWEELPKNANRKFRPKYSMQLGLTWEEADGEVTPILKNSFKLKGLPAVMIKGKECKKVHRQPEQFDPYAKAHDEDSDDENEEEFLLVRKKMSDFISINTQDLEEIYYKNSSAEILAAIRKREKIYVVSNSLQLPSQSRELQFKLEEELHRLSGLYMTRWLTGDCIEGECKGKGKVKMKLKKTGSLFDVGSEELHLQSLYSKTSYFILMEVEVALQLEKMLGRVSCCLYVASAEYQQVIDNLPRLSQIDLICFDSPQANKAFFEHLLSSEEENGYSGNEMDFLSLQDLSVECIVYELQKLKWRETQVMDRLDHIRQLELLQVITTPNSISLVDSDIVEELLDFFQEKGLNLAEGRSMMLVVCQDDIPEALLNHQDNWVFIFQEFEKVRIKGKEYFPLRRFREVIEQIKLKSKIYKESIGGQVVLRENSIIYTLPTGKTEAAVKVEAECRKVAEEFAFVKVTRKGVRVKVSWNSSKEARLLRTLCELKYISSGVLGDFNLISQRLCFRQLKEEIKYIIECLPTIFAREGATEIHEYEFSSPVSSSFSIKAEGADVEV